MANNISLKPFPKESDAERDYDILRSILLMKKFKEREIEMNDKQRAKFFHTCRMNLVAIKRLKQKYPVINEDIVKQMAINENVRFFFWIQKNSREKPKLVTNFGVGDLHINLKISGFENYQNISFRKMILLLKVEGCEGPYNSLKNKIRNFPSICDVVNYFTGSILTETEFFEIWGDHEIRFCEERKFSQVFQIGFTIWTDDLKYNKVLGTWSKKNIPILMKKAKYYRRKFSIFEELVVAIDDKILKDFRCQFCYAKHLTRANLSRHEKTCQNGTDYRYEERQYGSDVITPKASLEADGVLDVTNDYYKNFVSFDIECLGILDGYK